MLDVLQTRTENFEQPKNDSITSESPETSCVFRSMHLHYTAILFFSSEVLHEIWRIFPGSFDIVVISDVPTSHLIFCTKQMRKQSLFYRQHLERHVTCPECLHFFVIWRSWPYLFIFILKITLTANPSTFLLRCMSTFVPVHQYTYSVYFFFFWHNLHNDLSSTGVPTHRSTHK